jgi:hypothetical protein
VTARGTDACDPGVTLTDHNISTLNYVVCNGLKMLYAWPEWQMLPQDLEGIYIYGTSITDSNTDIPDHRFGMEMEGTRDGNKSNRIDTHISR